MKIKVNILLTIFLFSLYGCAITNGIYLNSVKRTADKIYGYSPENPIIFNKYKLDNSNTIIQDFIGRLYDSKNESYSIIQVRKVPNPLKEKPKNRAEVNPKLKYGTGDFIEEYTIKTKSSSKSIKLYFNLNVSSRRFFIPVGFPGYGYLSGK